MISNRYATREGLKMVKNKTKNRRNTYEIHMSKLPIQSKRIKIRMVQKSSRPTSIGCDKNVPKRYSL